MQSATFRAHYDGKHIVLDEPFELPTNAPLMVILLALDGDRSEWLALGAENLGRAYGDAEPEYSLADCKEQ